MNYIRTNMLDNLRYLNLEAIQDMSVFGYVNWLMPGWYMIILWLTDNSSAVSVWTWNIILAAYVEGTWRLHYVYTHHFLRHLDLYALRRRRLISIGIPIINLRRWSDRLRFIMGIPIPERRCLLSEYRPGGVRPTSVSYIASDIWIMDGVYESPLLGHL